MANRAPYRLKLLGSFDLTGPDGARIRIASRKGMALIALLALARGGQRTRIWLQDRLWGSRDREQASASLRRELANLRQLINPPGTPALLEADMHEIRLVLPLIDLDVLRLEANLPGDRAKPLAGDGELLEGFDIPGEEGFEEWLREQRARLSNTFDRTRSRAWREDALDPEREEPRLSPFRLAAGADPPLPLRPSISVMPFQSLGGPTHIADGLTEQISMTLGHWSTVFVVTAGACLAQSEDRALICRQLGVRYLLEGSVRHSGGRIRVAVRLIDGVIGEQLWTEQFEDETAAIFDVQDRIAEAVVPLIDSSMEKNERRHVAKRVQVGGDVHSHYWQANSLARRWEPDATKQAISHLDQVLELEPDNSWAASLVALCHAIQILQQWCPDAAISRAAVRRRIEQALRTGHDDPYVLGNAAGALLGVGEDLGAADAWIDRALAINPRMPATLFWGGWIDIALARPDRALERFTLGLRVNPKMAMRPYVLTGMGLALLALDRSEEAAPLVAEASAQLPSFAPAIVAAGMCDMLLSGSAGRSQWAARLEQAGGLRSAFALLRHPQHQALVRHIFGREPDHPSVQ